MTDKSQKHYQTVNYSIFEEGMKALGMTGPQLGEAIGYSRTAWNRWSENGKIPMAASLAIECLRRRRGPTTKAWILVVRGNTDHEKLAVEGVVKALGLTVLEV
jgi:hypothetical protein